MLSPTFYPSIGGVETMVRGLIVHLRSTDVEFSVVTRHFPGAPDEEVLDGAQIHRLFSPGRGRLGFLTFSISALFFLIRHRVQFDVIHVKPGGFYSLSALLVGKIFNKKVIINYGGHEFAGKFEGFSITAPLLFLVQRWWADRVLPLSQSMRKEAIRLKIPEGKISVLLHGIDTNRFHPSTRAEKKNRKRDLNLPEGLVAIFIGRFTTQKNLPFLLEFWGDIQPMISKPVSLVLIGAGPEEGRLRRRIEEKDLQEKVFIFGATHDPAPYYIAADVFLLPSLWEGLAHSFLEAMSCGLPCITSAICPGPEDVIINGQNGFALSLNQPEIWKEKLVGLLKDNDLREAIGKRARQTILDQHSMDQFAGQVHSIYESLFNEASTEM